jgi:hypothetical protein
MQRDENLDVLDRFFAEDPIGQTATDEEERVLRTIRLEEGTLTAAFLAKMLVTVRSDLDSL